MCERLLANPVIEAYEVTISDAGAMRHGRARRGRPLPRDRTANSTSSGRSSSSAATPRSSGTATTTTKGVDAIVVPGGFAHGDYLRTGAIARFSPVMNAVADFAAAGGPVVGICNGFQVLTEARAAARRAAEERGPEVPLRDRRAARRDDRLRAHQPGRRSGSVLRIPINHFEGNYVCDAETLAELRADDRVVVRYTQNPNGSLDDIAGICNDGPQRRRPDAAPGAGLGPDPRLRRRCRPLLRSLLAASVRVAGRELDVHLRRLRAGARAARRSSPTRSNRRRASSSATCHRPSAAYIVDLGCGPGYTTELLHDAFPLAQITGFDASDAMVDEARRACPDATFAIYDVTQPLLLPADVVYSRLLLGHLARPAAAMAVWAASLRPGSGLLACEEPVRYRSDDPYFQRYEEAVTAIVDARPARRLWASNSLRRRSARLRARARPGRRASGSGGTRRRRCSGATRRNGENVCPTAMS